MNDSSTDSENEKPRQKKKKENHKTYYGKKQVQVVGGNAKAKHSGYHWLCKTTLAVLSSGLILETDYSSLKR